MESIVLEYDEIDEIVYVKVLPQFSVSKYFNTKKLDSYRYVEEIYWGEMDKKITKPEKGDNIIIKYTTEGKIGLKYLIKKNRNIYRCVRINEKIYLIYCGNELQNVEFE